MRGGKSQRSRRSGSPIRRPAGAATLRTARPASRSWRRRTRSSSRFWPCRSGWKSWRRNARPRPAALVPRSCCAGWRSRVSSVERRGAGEGAGLAAWVLRRRLRSPRDSLRADGSGPPRSDANVDPVTWAHGRQAARSWLRQSFMAASRRRVALATGEPV